MRKQILAAFLSGLVVPLALMWIATRLDAVAESVDVESDGLTLAQQTEPLESVDSETSLVVQTENGNLRQMALDEYLLGVLLSELPTDFDDEAIKAQAVVARTYTCKRMDSSKHSSAAVCMDSGCCQGYIEPETYLRSGGAEATVEKLRRAISSTDGQVLTYNGGLIDATYFSCSGGSTEDAVAVWGQDVPYLQAVESPGEEAAPRYSEKVTFTPSAFAQLIGCSGEGSVESWFGATTYTEGGGVETMVICGKEYTGTQLRKLLSLRSTAFTVTAEQDCITIETRGYGHRVGMSQYGAQAMAENGSTYDEILYHYYRDTELERLDTDK